MADILLDRQRDYLAKVSHYPVAFICCQHQRRNKLLFSHVRFLFFLTFFPPPPPEQISALNIFSTSVTSKFLDFVRKWHHNPDDCTDIVFRPILSVFLFSLISSSKCNFSSAMSINFCCPVLMPDDLFSLSKFGFVALHWYSSSQHFIDLSAIKYRFSPG